ncbi:Kinesin- motor protein [Kalmusia sp. IMI 367209]|nr:Kinesin- motor protein [Kalmusia sp. IMI 367209]
MNEPIPEKKFLKEFTVEIERLKSELTATRQKNGVYLTHGAYEELTKESETSKISIKEQRETIETTERKLARKKQDLLELTSSFGMLKKNSEDTKGRLGNTKSLLERTEVALANARRMLADEKSARQQHEHTEQQLTILNGGLVTELDQLRADNTGLHSNLRLRSEQHAQNQERHGKTQRDVVDISTHVEGRLAEFQKEQQVIVEALSERVYASVKHELDELNAVRVGLVEKSIVFTQSHTKVMAQTRQSKDELNHVLEEVKTLRGMLEEKVGAGLSDLGVAARRILEGITAEVTTFGKQLHWSLASLSMIFKKTINGISKEMNDQRDEIRRLRDEMARANR